MAVPEAEGWRHPKWFSVGMEAVIPFVHEGKWTGLRCIVETATGDHARVVNTKRGIDKWVRLDGCVVPEGDCHTR